ncbi:duf1295 domain containing protein [Stylonychia lemnae]|uniref:Duf1295 domain containing protein n=1 Tax=Stylonychia lemnae TaxID=5949 RepID=A0A078AWP1_STYLE|nr:duf1295 domain containing protein [Stylonychia lemnae]|eukprot:CDW86579.1 duf1295 domain containing protein [Stylonychia lemnae]
MNKKVSQAHEQNQTSTQDIHILQWLMDHLMFEIGPGPKVMKLSYLVNFQKAGMCFYVLSLMFCFNNFSEAMWSYLLLHGSYGAFWILKDLIFPDPVFQKKATVFGLFTSFALVLGHYFVPAYMLASGRADNNLTFERIWVSYLIYVIGIILMLLSDSQKYHTLRFKKGLISDGMFKYTRNPNYFDEILVYGSFINLVNEKISYICVMQVWFLIFSLRMYLKDLSLRRKEGWEEYSQRSWLLVPKINGRVFDSLIFYSALLFSIYYCYFNGGFVKTAIDLRRILIKH